MPTGEPPKRSCVALLRVRDSTALSVVLIDVDHFKPVNDTWGHATGDAVLSSVGQLLKGSLRTGDVVGDRVAKSSCSLCRTRTLFHRALCPELCLY